MAYFEVECSDPLMNQINGSAPIIHRMKVRQAPPGLILLQDGTGVQRACRSAVGHCGDFRVRCVLHDHVVSSKKSREGSLEHDFPPGVTQTPLCQFVGNSVC